MEDPKQMNGNANEMANERLEPIPGPRVLPLVGNLFDLDLSNGLQAILDMAKKYGPIFRITVAGQTQIFAASREMVDEFCDESRFQKVVMGGARIPNVLMLQMKAHPELHTSARIGPTSPIDITEGFTKLTMDTLALCTASFRFNSFYRGSEEHPFVQAINEVLHEADLQSCFPDFINALRIFAARRLKRNMEFMRQVSQDIIQDRQNTSADSNDLLHALLSGRDSVTGKGLTEDQIINNLITFLVAGHETTAGMISFAVYYLLANPDCLRRARQEVDDVIGTDEVKVEHLSKLSYLEAVLKETLRLMPTAPGFSVAPSSPQTVGGKYLIQPGESVIILSAASHRDSSVFGDDADEFKPERMLEEKFNKLPRNSWKPFGNGKRGCIGRAFAWQEAHLIISMLLHNFDIEFDDPSYELRIHETLTIKPEGLLVRTKLREDREYTGLAIQAATNKGRLTQTGAANEPIGGPITILYGSNSGSCKSLAYRLASNASSRGYNQQRILTLDEAVGRLPTDQPVVIVTTSYNGEPTDDGREFVSWVKNVPKRGFAGVSYAVFGCGHRDWIQDFHRVPTLIDERIHKAGAHRLTGRGAADAAISDLYSDLEKWEEDHLWPAIRVKFPAAESSIDLSKLPQAEVHVKQPLRVTLNSRLTGVVVTEAHRLTSPEEPEKRHLEFAIPPESDLSLRPGDHLNILPRNPPRDVERVLSRFQLSPNHLLTVTSFHGGGIPVGTPLTATELFSAYVELAQPATPKVHVRSRIFDLN
ncbi:hypothetical protein N8T08_003266 [Aspergillus melleus]|uniref:Uncharacterized protein n=1 Tax=Aspergillus melleus TaxID=138277 RepID=A0ACC3B6P2_9EURO|nr:hypothetical protein N8T08_003266 [Aspergillus melleus]